MQSLLLNNMWKVSMGEGAMAGMLGEALHLMRNDGLLHAVRAVRDEVGAENTSLKELAVFVGTMRLLDQMGIIKEDAMKILMEKRVLKEESDGD